MIPTLPDILIVEDDDTIRMLLCEILSIHPVTVRSAGDGQTALELIQETVPAVLISDLHMPRMSGFELLAIVRQRYPETYLIATSGAYCGPDLPVGVPADAYYEKTSGIRNLIALVESGASRRSEQATYSESAPRIPSQPVKQDYSAAA